MILTAPAWKWDSRGGSLAKLTYRGYSPMDMGTEGKSNSWYAVRVRSRFENVVAKHLHARGYELFLPLYKDQRQWSDRLSEIELPLFPGYVFCRFNPVNRLPILSIPGVVHLVG